MRKRFEKKEGRNKCSKRKILLLSMLMIVMCSGCGIDKKSDGYCDYCGELSIDDRTAKALGLDEEICYYCFAGV